MLRRTLTLASLLLAATPALAQTPPDNGPPPPPPPDQPKEPEPPQPPTPPVTTVIVAPPPPTPAPPPPPEKPIVHSKFDVDLYGFVEFDGIYDTTQGLGDLAGNSTIARPKSYTGNHGQTMFGARNSRIGLKMKAPEYNSIKASAQLEMDFLGNQAGTPGTLYSTNTGGTASLVSEQSFWQNPTFRFRHLNVKMETPVVDVLIGQYWQLFGWQTMAHPNTVQIQGVAGQIYSRSPQIRLSKKLGEGDVTVEIAIAASRPPQRASATPDGQAGLKLNINKMKAWHTAGSTGSALDSAAIGVSVVGRRFAVDEFSATPSSQVVKNGYGLSIDGLIPIVPATKDHHENALTLTGSYVTGAGIADLYQSLSGGVSNPALPNPAMATPAPVYTPNVDPSMVMWYSDTVNGTFSLHPVQWTSYIVGLQYYLPPAGHAWISANYSHMSSQNAHYFGAANKVWDTEDWADGNLMFDITPAVRMGGEFSWTAQKFVDATTATDYRVQYAAFFLF